MRYMPTYLGTPTGNVCSSPEEAAAHISDRVTKYGSRGEDYGIVKLVPLKVVTTTTYEEA